VCGGAALVAKRLWDYFGRGHVRAHTGHPDKDLSDYLFFLVPLALLVAFVGLWRSASGATQAGKANLRVGLLGGVLQSLGEFGEAWLPHGIPWGIVGGSGLLLMSSSLVGLGLGSLRRKGLSSGGLLPLLLGLLFPLQMTAIMLPYHLWGDEFLAAQAGLAVTVVFGLSWVALGLVLWSGPGSVKAPGEAAPGPPSGSSEASASPVPRGC
jgi:hypothetical protein